MINYSQSNQSCFSKVKQAEMSETEVLCVGGDSFIRQMANEALITFSMGTIAK